MNSTFLNSSVNRFPISYPSAFRGRLGAVGLTARRMAAPAARLPDALGGLWDPALVDRLRAPHRRHHERN